MAISLPTNNVECPLCLNQMRVFETVKGRIYACLTKTCMVSIHEKDPALNQWHVNKDKAPPCVRCGTIMRWFFRAIDKFMVCQCPKCTKEGHMIEVRRGKVQDLNPNSKWYVEEGE